MVSAKRREDSTKRQQMKRLLDVGTENELKRKEKDKLRKKGKKNISCYRKKLLNFAYTRLRDILNKPPPRYGISSIQLSLVYIGGNKFADTNGEFVEVLYAGEKTLKNCINNNIELFEPVCFRGSLQYKKNPINNEKFDYFHIELYGSCGKLYFAAEPETVIYAEALVKGKDDLNKTELLTNSFQSFKNLLDLNMCSNWKNPRAKESYRLVPLAYEKLTGINTIVPSLID